MRIKELVTLLSQLPEDRKEKYIDKVLEKLEIESEIQGFGELLSEVAEIRVKDGVNRLRLELSDTINTIVGQLAGAKIISPNSRVVQNDAEGAYYYKDTADSTDYIWTNIQLNHDRQLGATMEAHLHWWQLGTSNPNWVIQYRYQMQGGLKRVDWNNLAIEGNAFTGGSSLINQISSFTNILPPASDGLSDMLQVRIVRDTVNGLSMYSGNDVVTGDVYIVGFDIHKPCDSNGSNQIYVK